MECSDTIPRGKELNLDRIFWMSKNPTKTCTVIYFKDKTRCSNIFVDVYIILYHPNLSRLIQIIETSPDIVKFYELIMLRIFA